MSIDEIAKLTTIKLPEPLELKEAEELINYIAKNMPANISYSVLEHTQLYHERETKGISSQKGSISINGHIADLLEAGAFDTFYSESSFFDDIPKLTAIKFMQVPGWEIEDYRPENRRIWASVRTAVVKYFSEKKR